MTRLDTVIKRLMAQRSCLNAAAKIVNDMPGPVLELGLGNGRTYDHLRSLFPERDIFVFDREVASHPDCRPDPDHLFLGSMQETLIVAAEKLGRTAVLAHADIGFGDAKATERNIVTLGPMIPTLVRSGGLVICDQSLSRFDELTSGALPPDVESGRYHVYCRN
ncbi:MAG: hypothetical protein CMM55_02970 [Rhodospirillaceae bacterium]|nr:hypothetical protein [Rhodospirillaceae bacterium]